MELKIMKKELLGAVEIAENFISTERACMEHLKLVISGQTEMTELKSSLLTLRHVRKSDLTGMWRKKERWPYLVRCSRPQ